MNFRLKNYPDVSGRSKNFLLKNPEKTKFLAHHKDLDNIIYIYKYYQL
jgi:hypothetical protein